MTQPRSDPTWVREIAKTLAADRRAVIEYARRQDANTWSAPSGVGVWTRRDVLAHLAGGNDQMIQTVLRAVTQGHALEPAMFDPDTDAENEQRVRERRRWADAQIIAELERDGAEMQELLAVLRPDHRDLPLPGGTMTLGGLLGFVLRERHDHEHLEQLKRSEPRR